MVLYCGYVESKIKAVAPYKILRKVERAVIQTVEIDEGKKKLRVERIF
jgi:hypothetical protein